MSKIYPVDFGLLETGNFESFATVGWMLSAKDKLGRNTLAFLFYGTSPDSFGQGSGISGNFTGLGPFAPRYRSNAIDLVFLLARRKYS